MANDHAPTLDDDEAKLLEYAAMLADEFDQVAVPWLRRLVDARAPGMAAMPPVLARLREGADTVSEELRALLARDIADQPVAPLEILRRAIRFPTAVLADASVSTVARDEFAVTRFPDDVYNLTPASFADVDPLLHEPGLTWGAAKAHVHLRRRREATEQSTLEETNVMQASVDQSREPGKVVALSADLMDRSKISAAFPDAILVRSSTKLLETATGADLVLVDLNRLGDLADLVGITARVVAFGSHVDDAQLTAATEAGAEAIPRSVFFRRLEARNL